MTRAFAVLALIGAWPALAGQLVIDSYSMLDVHVSGGSVVLGTVVSVHDAKPRDPVLELRLKRVYAGAGAQPSAWRPGAVVTVHLDPGVEWLDEHVSPIERRLYGAIQTAKAGTDVIVVMEAANQMLAATPATLRAAEIIFDADARQRYANETRAHLEADLADDHLVTLALDALSAQGGPSAAAFLRVRYSLRSQRYKAMDAAARKRFLADAASAARKDRALLKPLADIALDDVDPATLPELGQISALFDATRKDDLDAIDRLRTSAARLVEDPASTADLTPLAGMVAAYYVHRPPYHREDGELARMTAHMSPDARVSISTAFLASVHTSTEASRGVDGFLLSEAARILVETPNASALPALAKVDPSRESSTGGQSAVLGDIARIGNAIVEVSPVSAPEVKRILAAASARVPRASMPPPPRPPPPKRGGGSANTGVEVEKHGPLVEETFTLAPGESHRFANGGELNNLRDPWVLTVDCDNTIGNASLSYTTPTGYREWWECGYLLRIRDAGKQRQLKVIATPMAVPPARMSFDAAAALGEKALEGRACSGSSTSQDGDMGWMQFEATTKAGKPCRVLMGMYSRTVIRVDAPAK